VKRDRRAGGGGGEEEGGKVVRLVGEVMEMAEGGRGGGWEGGGMGGTGEGEAEWRGG
jgi:hypothetical protein